MKKIILIICGIVLISGCLPKKKIIKKGSNIKAAELKVLEKANSKITPIKGRIINKKGEGIENVHIYITYISSATGVSLEGWKLKLDKEIQGSGTGIYIPDYTKPDKRIVWDKVYESTREKSGKDGSFNINKLHMHFDMVPHIKEDTKIEPIECLMWITAVGYKQKLVYIGVEDSSIYQERAKKYDGAIGIAKSVYMTPEDVEIRLIKKEALGEGLNLREIKLEEPKPEKLYEYVNSFDASNISWWGVTALSAQTGASQQEKQEIMDFVKQQGEWAVKKAKEELSGDEAQKIKRLWEEKYKVWQDRVWDIRLFAIKPNEDYQADSELSSERTGSNEVKNSQTVQRKIEQLKLKKVEEDKQKEYKEKNEIEKDGEDIVIKDGLGNIKNRIKLTPPNLPTKKRGLRHLICSPKKKYCLVRYWYVLSHTIRTDRESNTVNEIMLIGPNGNMLSKFADLADKFIGQRWVLDNGTYYQINEWDGNIYVYKNNLLLKEFRFTNWLAKVDPDIGMKVVPDVRAKSPIEISADQELIAFIREREDWDFNPVAKESEIIVFTKDGNILWRKENRKRTDFWQKYKTWYKVKFSSNNKYIFALFTGPTLQVYDINGKKIMEKPFDKNSNFNLEIKKALRELP